MAVSLEGKHILITGASKGLGRSLAAKFHKTGARLSLTARSLDELNQLKSELGKNVEVYGADLTERSQCDAMLAYFRKKSGPFFGLINNAGAAWYKPFADYTTKENDFVLDINFNSLVYITHQVLPDMKTAGKGSILNIASDLARRPLANMTLYTAVKHAVAGFSQSLARELKGDNIRVMMLAPGLIDTGFGGRNPGDIKPPVALNPDDVADVCLFMMTRPEYVILDEVSIHPTGQDF